MGVDRDGEDPSVMPFDRPADLGLAAAEAPERFERGESGICRTIPTLSRVLGL
jgi:hypothetical protein